MSATSPPYIGEIRMFAGTFAPSGWAVCDGTLLPISRYSALFSLIGTTYGGDGNVSFALPDLRSRIPVGTGSLDGQAFVLGQQDGAERVALTTANVPEHAHDAIGDQQDANRTSAAGAIPATASTASTWYYSNFRKQPDPVGFAPDAVGEAGLGEPLSLVQPVLAITFIIALTGSWPIQS